MEVPVCPTRDMLLAATIGCMIHLLAATNVSKDTLKVCMVLSVGATLHVTLLATLLGATRQLGRAE